MLWLGLKQLHSSQTWTGVRAPTVVDEQQGRQLKHKLRKSYEFDQPIVCLKIKGSLYQQLQG